MRRRWWVGRGTSGGGLLCFLSPRQSEPLQRVVDHMATHLGVSPSRILLLFGETELSPTATPRTLKLGVADIIGERQAGRWSLEEAFAAGRDEGKEVGPASRPCLGLAS